MIRPALTLLLLFTGITGLAYPAVITGVAHVAWPEAANGSLVSQGDQLIGSSLIGQTFTGPGFVWSRPSATTPPYNAAASSGSNLGPTNPALATAVTERLSHFSARPPVDLLTTSGSGLDPHISPEAAEFQVARVAQARGLPESQVRELVTRVTEGRTWGLWGEPRVNVLRLNLALLNQSP